MFTILLISRALWGGEAGKTPRLILAAWVAISLAMPFQMAVPAALAGEQVAEMEILGAASLMGPLEDAAMPEFAVQYLDCVDVLGVLGPENALVLTSMDDFRRLMRSDE